MGKPARKRYWRNWDTVIVLKNEVPQDFKKEVYEWAHQNRVPLVVREGSRKATPTPDGYYLNGSYETFWKCHIQHPKNITLFRLKWG